MITTYTPSRCRYTIDRLKQHVYLISAASCTIHIDNGNAWVDNLTETPLFIKGAVTLNESTSYDDRFKFTKSVSLTVQNYVNLSYLQGKYYVILEDEGGNYWFVNPDFPCLVTYTYTLGDDVSETEFTFNSLSNFPLLRFTGSLTDVRECEQYVINGLKRLRLTEAKNTSYDQSTSTVYLYNGKEFYDVEFLDGTLSITEEFDGNQVNTSIQFAIQLDSYKPSWQYNLLEYQDNRYAAIITTKGADGEFISGFEFGLVPSYSIVGGDSQDDIITITLQGASSYGSLPSGGEESHSVAKSRWTVVEKPVEYTWRLTNESSCLHIEYRWVNLDPSVDYYCSGVTKYYQEQLQKSYDSGETWINVEQYRMGDSAETKSVDCGYASRWVNLDPSIDYYCSGTTKFYKQQMQESSDYGSTWSYVPGQYRWGDMYEKLSTDCGYVPRASSSGDYFTVYSVSGGTYNLKYHSTSSSKTGYYWSTDDGETWTFTKLRYPIVPRIEAGKRIMFKANWNNESTIYSGIYLDAGPNGAGITYSDYHVEGNILSLVYGDDFKTLPNYGLNATTNGLGVFSNIFHGWGSNHLICAHDLLIPTAPRMSPGVFAGCSGLITPPQLPATTMENGTYESMFAGCTSLTTLPELPATTLTTGCYKSMFQGCTSLTTAPELPATTLAGGCYESMFKNCTSLMVAPDLPASYLPSKCYYEMFNGCSELTTPPTSIGTSATTMEQPEAGGKQCAYMFQGCTSLTTAPELPATNLASLCYTSMFAGCTSLTTPPVLPATTLAAWCYQNMFYGCASLTTAPNLPATTLAGGCYSSMFAGCTSLTTAPTLPATTSPDACYWHMFHGCTSLATTPALSATKLGVNSCTAMFYGCTSLTSIAGKLGDSTKAVGLSACTDMFNGCTSLSSATVEIDAALVGEGAYRRMFNGCRSLVVAPVSIGNENTMFVGDTHDARHCASMFAGCTSLTTAPELPATTLEDYCYESMFTNCTSLTTVQSVLPATTLKINCYMGMFQGCTSLTTAPILPATTLKSECYAYMFYGCSSLNYIKCLATTLITTNPHYSTRGWVSGVAASGTFVKDSNMTSWPVGGSGIPSGWTVQDYSTQSRTISGTPYCTGIDKYIDVYDQVSYDDGATWITTATTTTLVESKSTDCGFSARTVSTATTCVGVDKHYLEEYQESSDYGVSWTTISSTTGSLIEANSADCGYAERTISGTPYCDGTDLVVRTSAQTSSDSGQSWTTISTAITLVESGSSECSGTSLSGDYLTLVALEDGTFTFYPNSSTTANAISYSIDNGATWTNPSSDYATTPTITSGNKVLWKGTVTSSGNFSSTGRFNAQGNVMSMIYGDNFENQTSFPSSGVTLNGLFKDSKLISAERLSLPAATLTQGCYSKMFRNCTSLTTPPELPASTLSESAYTEMFGLCRSLTIAPDLPATSISVYSYYQMFWGCTSLASTPVISATTLGVNCCQEMFSGCTHLTTASSLPAMTMAEDCYYGMFYGCTSLATPPALPATTLARFCYCGMFQGCTSLTTAPVLPAEILVQYCYSRMFSGCTNLDNITCLATDRSAGSCTTNWVKNVASNGTFVKAASTTSWSRGVSGIPDGWTVQNAT